MRIARFLALGIAAAMACPAVAAPRPIRAETVLRHCGAATCLLVRGYRPDASAPIALAGHDVSIEGAHNWRVALPLETVRAWSPPGARTIAVRVGGMDGDETQARLPIGLFGHVTDLAFLDVRAPH